MNNNGINENNKVNEESNLVTSQYITKCNTDTSKTITVYGDVSKYLNIFEYINNQKDVSIKLNYCTNEIESEGEAGVFYKTTDYNLTKEEISTFLSEMKNISSRYLEGGHSNQCSGKLTITYKIKDNLNIVEIDMTQLQILSSTDGNIYKIIESNTTQPTPSYCLYSAGTSSQTITNIINKLKQ